MSGDWAGKCDIGSARNTSSTCGSIICSFGGPRQAYAIFKFLILRAVSTGEDAALKKIDRRGTTVSAFELKAVLRICNANPERLCLPGNLSKPPHFPLLSSLRSTISLKASDSLSPCREGLQVYRQSYHCKCPAPICQANTRIPISCKRSRKGFLRKTDPSLMKIINVK